MRKEDSAPSVVKRPSERPSYQQHAASTIHASEPTLIKPMTIYHQKIPIYTKQFLDLRESDNLEREYTVTLSSIHRTKIRTRGYLDRRHPRIPVPPFPLLPCSSASLRTDPTSAHCPKAFSAQTGFPSLPLMLIPSLPLGIIVLSPHLSYSPSSSPPTILRTPNPNNNHPNMSPPVHASIRIPRVFERKRPINVRMWMGFRRGEPFGEGAEAGVRREEVEWRSGSRVASRVWCLVARRAAENNKRSSVSGEGIVSRYGVKERRQKERKRVAGMERRMRDGRRRNETKRDEVANEASRRCTYFPAPLMTTPLRHTFFAIALSGRADRSAGACC